MPVPCPHCAEPVRSGVNFCPRCGKSVPVHASIDFGKMSAPIPKTGILFLLCLVLGPAALIAGIAMGSKALIFSGVTILVGLVLILVLGEFL